MSTPQSQTQLSEAEDNYEQQLQELEEEAAREEQERVAEEKRRREESERRVRERKEALLKKKAEAEAEKKKKAEEEARRKAEEEARRRAEEALREVEEARRRAEEVQRAQQSTVEEHGEALGTPKRKATPEVEGRGSAKRAKKSGKASLTIRLPVAGSLTQVDESVVEVSEEEEIFVVREKRSRKQQGNYNADGSKVKMGGGNRCSQCMANGKECLPSEGEKIFSCARCAASKYKCTLGTEADLPEGERQLLLVNEMWKLRREQRRANQSMVAKLKRVEGSNAALLEVFRELAGKLTGAGVVPENAGDDDKETAEMEE